MGRIWRSELVQLLIETVKKCEYIWNSKHPLYTTNKHTRSDIWKEVADYFNQRCGQLKFKSVELYFKWNSLRVGFERESKRVTDLGLKCSRWKYYDMLMFLVNHPRKKNKAILHTPKKYSLRRRTVDESEEVSVGSISPMNSPTKSDQQIVAKCTAGVNAIASVSQAGQAGLESTFGEYVAAEMRHLELDLQLRAKTSIFDILMKLQFEQETRNR